MLRVRVPSVTPSHPGFVSARSDIAELPWIGGSVTSSAHGNPECRSAGYSQRGIFAQPQEAAVETIDRVRCGFHAGASRLALAELFCAGTHGDAGFWIHAHLAYPRSPVFSVR